MRMTEAERHFYLHRPPPTRGDNSGMAYVTTAFVNHAKAEADIMRAMKGRTQITVSELAMATGYSRQTVTRRLRSLRSDGMVRMIRARMGGTDYWWLA